MECLPGRLQILVFFREKDGGAVLLFLFNFDVAFFSPLSWVVFFQIRLKFLSFFSFFFQRNNFLFLPCFKSSLLFFSAKQLSFFSHIFILALFCVLVVVVCCLLCS